MSKCDHNIHLCLEVERIHSQSFHQQRVIAAFIVEEFMRIIGKHVDTKLLKTLKKVNNRNYLRREIVRGLQFLALIANAAQRSGSTSE